MIDLKKLAKTITQFAKRLGLNVLFLGYQLTKLALIAAIGGLGWFSAGPIADHLVGFLFDILHTLGGNPNSSWSSLASVFTIPMGEHTRHFAFNYAYMLTPVIMAGVYWCLKKCEARLLSQWQAKVGASRQPELVQPLSSAHQQNLTRSRSHSYGGNEQPYHEQSVHHRLRHVKEEWFRAFEQEASSSAACSEQQLVDSLNPGEPSPAVYPPADAEEQQQSSAAIEAGAQENWPAYLTYFKQHLAQKEAQKREQEQRNNEVYRRLLGVLQSGATKPNLI